LPHHRGALTAPKIPRFPMGQEGASLPKPKRPLGGEKKASDYSPGGVRPKNRDPCRPGRPVGPWAPMPSLPAPLDIDPAEASTRVELAELRGGLDTGDWVGAAVGKPSRVCAGCGVPIDDRRQETKWCSQQCRSRTRRASTGATEKAAPLP